jgi:hypothetical protein
MAVNENVITFRVYIKSLYFDVYVWRTKALMYQELSDVHPRNFAAICRNETIYDIAPGGGAMHKSPCLGEIHFHRKKFYSYIIVHEATHAALGWAERKGLDIKAKSNTGAAHPNEEALCSAVHTLARQMFAHGVRHKLFKWAIA